LARKNKLCQVHRHSQWSASTGRTSYAEDAIGFDTTPP